MTGSTAHPGGERPLATTPIGPGDEALRRAASDRVLLVACDFDGTLSPIAPTPADARPDSRALDALAALARLPRTYAAVISGRSLDELRAFLGPSVNLYLVGSHGAESTFWSVGLESEEIERIGVLRAEADRIASMFPGAHAEHKRLGAALHYRRCSREDAASVRRLALEGPAALPGTFTIEGHEVIEFAVRPQDKGAALAALRYRLGAGRAVFIGDDRTDEAAFELMGNEDLSVRVGVEPTKARCLVGSQADVAPLLESLLDLRRETLQAESPQPITDLAMLSDQRTVALVDDRGTIPWMCLPRADSGSIFGSLLGEAGGRFTVRPRGVTTPGEQAYVGDSMIVRTRWPGHSGSVLTLTDYLDCSSGRAYQRAGRSDLIRVLEGEGEWEILFEPAPDFGRGRVTLAPVSEGLRVESGAELAVLLSEGVPWTVRPTVHGDAASAVVRTGPDPLVLEWRWGQGGVGLARQPEPHRREQTARFWSGWANSLVCPSLAKDDVKRSALVLKALCHGPTGGILAAATSSLPEQLGGVRNWDYRFCWPRDACLAARALLRLGNSGVAMKLLDWLVGVVASEPSPDRLRPIYTVSGGHLWPEAEITALSGYHRSVPVRIGNAADNQVQLDVFGPIVDLAAALAESGTPVTPEHWRLVQSMVEAVEARWREPDHGIWEIRGPKQRHVHSAVMCWLAAHRGAQVAREVTGRAAPAWESLAETIRDDVLTHGYHAQIGAFTAAYGSRHLDAAALWVVLSGLLPPDDPRAVATVRKVESSLRRGPVVYRYEYDDGLPGREGGFVILSFWLAEALWMIGDRDAALDLFHRARALRGVSGLLAEQHEPDLDLPLGNYPQAYSHLGLINAAIRLSGPGSGRATPPQ